MDGRHRGIVFDDPPPVPGRSAERDLFIIKEEIFVHAAELAEQPAVDQHAGPGDPIDGPRPVSPIGLVFPPMPWYQLLPTGTEQAGEGPDGGLPRPVRVAELEADHPRRTRGSTLEFADPLIDPTQHPRAGDDVRIEDEEP